MLRYIHQLLTGCCESIRWHKYSHAQQGDRSAFEEVGKCSGGSSRIRGVSLSEDMVQISDTLGIRPGYPSCPVLLENKVETYFAAYLPQIFRPRRVFKRQASDDILSVLYIRRWPNPLWSISRGGEPTQPIRELTNNGDFVPKYEHEPSLAPHITVKRAKSTRQARKLQLMLKAFA